MSSKIDEEREKKSAAAEAVFNEIYEKFYKSVYSYFLARTGREDLAVDLMQDVFLKIWQHIDNIRNMDAERHRYWIFAVAKNSLADYFRRKARRKGIEEQMHQQVQQTAAEGPESRFDQKEKIASLDKAVHNLSEELRTVFVMHVIGEMNSSQIGEALGKPPGTIRYQLWLARKKIARELERLEYNTDMGGREYARE